MNAITAVNPTAVCPEPLVTAPQVLVAINRVMEEIGREGIAKDRRNDAQKYSFRGIDDVYNALAPILARNKLIIKPRGLRRVCEERQTKSGGTMFYVNVDMEFDLISAEDGSREVAGPFYGEAMDSADKATNKAQSAAYKYMAMQVFCIPTEGDNDADASHHDVAPRKPMWQTAAEAAIIMLRSTADCADWYRKNVAMLKAQPQENRDEVLALLKRQKEGLADDEAKAAREAEEQRFRREGTGPVAGRNGHAANSLPIDSDEIPF